MLTNEDHGGVIYFMGGIVILVMVGVGLSVLVDHRLDSSGGTHRVRGEMQLADEELQMLRSSYEESSLLLAELGSKSLNSTAARVDLDHQQRLLRQRHSDLVEKRRIVLAEIRAIEQDFSSYRAEYQRRIRLAARGEKIGTLSLRGDRKYHEVEIIRVTGVGIHIRHQHGMARVMFADLDPKWQERFQWRDGDS